MDDLFELVDCRTGEVTTVTSGGQLAVPGDWRATGVILPADLSFDAWQHYGQLLQRLNQATLWWWGDWWRFGERAYGEAASHVSLTPYAYQTLHDAAWVCNRIEFSRRRENLTFSHHREVAALAPDEQDQWLDAAAAAGWTRQELRTEMQRAKRTTLYDAKQAQAWPTGRYSVIYADPPWSYSNSGFAQSAASQYPTLPTATICTLPVPALAYDDAALLLWVTSPLLTDGLTVLEAWGFTYKASMVWVKPQGPGIGWFVDTRHELLLIGAKGQAHPKVTVPSVLAASVESHSRKPAEFYTVIETMYPNAPRIELFARTPRDGWDRWGNEPESVK